MGDNTVAGSAAAAPYVYLSSLYSILLEFLCLVFAVDWICLSAILVVCMASLLASTSDIIYMMFIRINLYTKLLIYSTVNTHNPPEIKTQIIAYFTLDS